MNILKNNIYTKKSTKTKFGLSFIAAIVAISLSACSSDSDDDEDKQPEPTPPVAKQFNLIQGTDTNNKNHPLLSLNPGGPGGSPNQSLRAADVIVGAEYDDILIGGLGVDVLIGYEGDDILIGGTEDFNSSVDGDDKGSDNRDRAFGYDGDDTFIWAPGDGNDFFDGGDGIDVVIFGVLGEASDADGSVAGAPFFNVNPPSASGSQDFDGIFLNENSQPVVQVTSSPGFCSVLAKNDNQAAFSSLEVDNVVRFSLRAIADAFDAGNRNDDDGLRVAISLKNTEFLVCTKRTLDAEDASNNIEVLDISGDTPVAATVADLPEYVQNLLQ